MQSETLTILMAEDEEHDVFFVRHALRRLAGQHRLYAVHDGEEAIAYLPGKGQYADRTQCPMPNLIMTDLKMPKVDGFGLLGWLREQPHCMVIPTVVFTSSHLEADVRKAYALGANAYLAKPNGLEEMTEFLRLTSQFWSRCEFPPIPGKC